VEGEGVEAVAAAARLVGEVQLPSRPVKKRDAHHLPVLLDQVLEVIDPRPGQVIVDCTLGLGGHSSAILERLKPDGRLIGIDFDPANIKLARGRLEKAKGRSGVRFDLFHNNFAALPTVIAEAGVEGGRVDAVLADIGVASTQIDDPARGFSYRKPGPLDMRMDPTRGQPAWELIRRMSEKEMAEAFLEYGDEEDAAEIAALIVERRKAKPIATTEELMAIVCEARDFTIERGAGAKLHPAARTFQALRILVNREMANLDRLLAVMPDVLKPGGVGAIISFHSGEDRRVKHAFMKGFREGVYSQESRDPLVASEDEVRYNARARSAKLRWVRLADPHGQGAHDRGANERRTASAKEAAEKATRPGDQPATPGPRLRARRV
jgi:16S rRNA (cytosine1402-N4)-methyltransferase